MQGDSRQRWSRLGTSRSETSEASTKEPTLGARVRPTKTPMIELLISRQAEYGYTFIVVEIWECRINFCRTPMGAPESPSQDRQVSRKACHLKAPLFLQNLRTAEAVPFQNSEFFRSLFSPAKACARQPELSGSCLGLPVACPMWSVAVHGEKEQGVHCTQSLPLVRQVR
jgi:hypothetical protein